MAAAICWWRDAGAGSLGMALTSSTYTRRAHFRGENHSGPHGKFPVWQAQSCLAIGIISVPIYKADRWKDDSNVTILLAFRMWGKWAPDSPWISFVWLMRFLYWVYCQCQTISICPTKFIVDKFSWKHWLHLQIHAYLRLSINSSVSMRSCFPPDIIFHLLFLQVSQGITGPLASHYHLLSCFITMRSLIWFHREMFAHTIHSEGSLLW